jgi:hypothetical protein
MARWHPVNAYQMQLSWLSLTGDVARLQRVLETLSDAIKASDRRLDAAQRAGNAEWAEVVLGEECAITEDLIGTAFVVCQTYITGVASRVIGLHHHHDRENPDSPLQTTSGNKYQSTTTSPSIFRFGSRKIGRSGRTAVEVIDGFANYFKHHEEWVGTWTKLKGRAQKQRRPSWPLARSVEARGTCEPAQSAWGTRTTRTSPSS